LNSQQSGARTQSSPSEPTFAEPWQARAFALALELKERGHFTQREWTHALAAAIQQANARDQSADDGSHYYDHWLAALEALTVTKGLTDKVALSARKQAWRDAYHRTPHGKPVTLEP
jgi:nitrile hydratase accessory protein